ncbi:hypothetical protein TW1_025 [Pseudoalteromonas phage TW1]|uniref:hypothetical protein n=1 Tax=Pseudoalteromonas phage TW1 TaxID=1366055 RepID=UPI00035AB1B2|nr:hypothetical protein PP585_gp25 [Pseudoalteromonas phage TW1]AGR46541.1 hypothetical protein TW1_025 [Pseudoalteromonas phage TW1]
MMAKIKPILIQEDKVCISVHVIIEPQQGRGYENRLNLHNKDGEGWVCHADFSDMPPQDSFESAIERMKLYLDRYSKALKSNDFKHLNPDKIFSIKHTK